MGVGAVVVDGGRVLLVQRGRPPALGRWSEADALGALDVTEGVESMVRRAFALEAERRREEQEG